MAYLTRPVVRRSLIATALAAGALLPLFGGFAAAEQALRKPAVDAKAETAGQPRIVIVEWRITKGREQEFLDYWSTRATVKDRSGLIGEFLSGQESRERFPWMNWQLDERWTTYYNVGLWRDAADFEEQIGKFIDNNRPPLAFEADRRRRIFLAPERWRVGGAGLPSADPQGVQ